MCPSCAVVSCVVTNSELRRFGTNGEVLNVGGKLDYSSPPFFLRDSRASKTRARVKITPREKRRHAAGREKNEGLQTKPKLLNYLS